MADDTAHGNPWGSPVVVSAPRPATPSPPRAARKEVITPPAPTPAPLAGRLPTVSPPSLAADLREGVRALLASGGRHADLLLASRDGERLPAHRCILEARLGQPLVARLVDATADGACALDAPARAVGALLRYVYTEDVAAAEAEDAPGTAADGAEVERGDARAWAERAQPHFEIIALCAALDAAVGVDSDADDDGGGGDNGTRGAAADGSGAGGVRALRRLRELSEAAIAPLVDPSTAALAASAAWRNGGPQLLEHSLSLLLFKLETAADALGPAAAAADVYVVAELLLRAAADGCALHLALAAGRDDVAAAILGDLGELEAADAAADASAERALAASAGVTDAIGEARVEVGLGVAAPRERELPPPCAPLARLPRLAAARAAGGDARRRLLSARDGVGRTALEVALLARGDVRAAARLLRAGADADARTAGGGRSLLCALCALAGDGGARDGGGAAAAGGGGVAVAGVPGSLDAAAAVRLLLRAGADPNLAVADADPAAAAAAAAAGAAAAAAAAAASGGESRDELCGLRALDIALWCGADALVPQLVEAGAQLAAQAEPSTSGGVRAQLVSASAASAHLLIRAAQRSGAGQAQPAQPLARVLGWAVWARAQSGGTAAAATPAAAAPPPRPPPPAAAAAAVAAALSCLRVDAEDRRLGTTALLCAVDAGNEAALHALLAAGASPAAAASNGRLPLQAAVERSDFNSLHALLAAGAHADALCGGGAMGVPLLVLAAGAADATLALTLLECGADMDASAAGDGRGALGEAVRRGSADLVRALLERGARPAAGKDEAGNTLLHAAVLRAAPPTPKAAKAAKAAKRAAAAAGARPPPPTDAAALEASACEVVEGLLAYDLDVFEPDARGCTPLHLAARLGSARLCQLLLRAGADVHACDGAAEARTPAEVALEGRHLQALRVLLQGGRADVDRQTRRGSPLLHLAAAAGDAASVQLLMEMHAHIDSVNPNGESALHWAAALGHADVVRGLLARGASVALKDKVRGFTALHAACSARGSVETAALILARCEELGWHALPGGIDSADLSGCSALHVGAREPPLVSVSKMVALLVGSGGSVTLADARGGTVLHALAERGDGVLDGGGALLDLLAAQRLPLDAQTRDGANSALHVAAFGGAERLARFLAAQGAWVSLPNGDGLCPLDTAQRCADGTPLKLALLRAISRPPNWVRDRSIHACQLCKSPFGPTVEKPAILPQRKHHCRHCGRCICAACSPAKLPILKFGAGASSQPERVCVECVPVVAAAAEHVAKRP